MGPGRERNKYALNILLFCIGLNSKIVLDFQVLFFIIFVNMHTCSFALLFQRKIGTVTLEIRVPVVGAVLEDSAYGF